MASLVQELLDGLRKETDIYDSLLTLAEDKRKTIISGETDALEVITASEEETSSALRGLESKRTNILKDMAVVLGMDGQEMTVTAVINHLDAGVEKDKLTAARDTLVDTATKLQIANTQNSILLQQALEMVEFDLTLFKSMKQAPETANYNNKAYNTGDLLGGTSFNQTQ